MRYSSQTSRPRFESQELTTITTKATTPSFQVIVVGRLVGRSVMESQQLHLIWNFFPCSSWSHTQNSDSDCAIINRKCVVPIRFHFPGERPTLTLNIQIFQMTDGRRDGRMDGHTYAKQRLFIVHPSSHICGHY